MDEKRQIRVLLIEDDQGDAWLFRSLVQAEAGQIDLQWTDHLSSAVERLTNETFDFVVVDLELPDSKGLETFTTLHSRVPYTPIVVLSGVNDQEIAIEAVKNGAQDYLIKGRAKGDSIIRLIRYSIERQKLVAECEKHLKGIRTLKGLITMCAWCRKVHSDRGQWETVERYISEHTDASFSHGICPECLEKTEPEIFELMKKESPDLFESGVDTSADPSQGQRVIKVLLIEDDAGDADLVRALAGEVTDARLKIYHVDRLSSAIELFEHESFDIVLSDLGLPDSQGLETFIRLSTASPDVPIVLLTGLSDRELAATAVRSGAQDYVVKGEVDSKLLWKSIQYAIGRNRILIELRNNLRKVAKLERERENVLSMFAHDIKNAIVPSVWLLSRMLAGKSKIPDTDIASIRAGLTTAEQLLVDFIEFSRLRAKEIKPILGPFDIAAAIRKQIEASQVKAAGKKIEIDYQFSGEPYPSLAADKMMMERLISNLLDNAIKYTPAGGAVNVKVRKLKAKVLVQMQDSGIGIPEDQIPHIFDAFYRVPGTEKGSGLGLSIAKTIVNAHGGDIWVESAPGKGSTFSFTLPQRSV